MLSAQERWGGMAGYSTVTDGTAKEGIGDGALGVPVDDPCQITLTFNGEAAEYFRLWVVQTLLCIVTLGLYSPWAKVRKARWFAQHTLLLGHRFDYHGRPGPILVGRLVALVLVVLWTNAFDFSFGLGVATLVMVALIGPYLFGSAQRFRLANTSWRGMRFDFQAQRRDLYRIGLPAIVLWGSGGLLAGLGASNRVLVGSALLLALLAPFFHARLKRLQHAQATFAGRRFRCSVKVESFYGLYLKALGVLAASGLIGMGLFTIGVGIVREAERSPQFSFGSVLSGLFVALFAWLLTWPYWASRVQRMVWGRTRWGPVRFRGTLSAKRLWAVVLGGPLLTLVTAGLAWPFLAVWVARARVESLQVFASKPLSQLDLVSEVAPAVGATGDAAADLFGLDLGW